MRSSISIVLFSLMMFVGFAFAQNDSFDGGSSDVSSGSGLYQDVSKGEKSKISHVSNSWYVGGTEVSPDAVVALLQSNPEAASEYSTGRMFYYPSLVLGGIGGFALGYGAVSWIMGKDFGMPMTLGGVGVVGVAFLLGYISGNYTDSAIEIYNKSLSAETSFKVQLVPTVQGGIALAFAI